MRIVSLLSSATEIVCALGGGDCLVGRSHECDNPDWVRSLPACSEPAFDISVSSGDIDREVNRRLRAGEPLYVIHSDRIRELAPDLIIAQSHCEVCAVTPGDVNRSGCIPGARVLSLTASTVDEIFNNVGEIAAAIGRDDEAVQVVRRERERLERLRSRTAELPRRSIAVLEWVDPIFPMGNWGPELVDAANGRLVMGNRGQHSHAVPCEQLREADPEYLVIAPCGFNLVRAMQELAVLQNYEWWSGLRAVREGKVAFADGNLFFNRSGLTITRTAEILAEILHGLVTAEPAEGRYWLWMRDVKAEGLSAA